MIIHEPEIKIKGDEVSYSARIELSHPGPDTPERLWFKFPKNYESWINQGSESFAAALLLVAMYWGEDLEIRGNISPKFAYGFEEYKNIFHLWKPNLFQQIAINYQSVESLNVDPTKGKVLTAFSGGVDSTFTLWKNLPENQKLEQHQISHGFFMQGIDYGVNDDKAYQSTLKKYSDVFSDLNIELISARTNASVFSKYRLNHSWIIGGILIGTALALGGGFQKILIPSSSSYADLTPLGSLPTIDYLLSIDSSQVIHHGSLCERNEKLQRISNWHVPKNNLRVCSSDPKLLDGFNCSSCRKCLQTMMMLELLGVLTEYSTFTRPFNMASFIPFSLNNKFLSIEVNEMTELAIKKRRWGFVLGLVLVRIGGIIRRNGRSLFMKLVGEDNIYKLKNWYFEREKVRSDK